MKSGPGNQAEPLQPNQTKPNLSSKTLNPMITMLPLFSILNAGYYGLTILPLPDAKRGSPEEYPCAPDSGRGVHGNC